MKISPQELKSALESHDLPSFVVDLILTYQKAVTNDELSVTNHLVKEVTGKSPRDIKLSLK